MFELFEKVKIKSSGKIGTIVDIDTLGGITVEDDEYYNPSGEPYCGEWRLYHCYPDDLVRVPDDTEAVAAIA